MTIRPLRQVIPDVVQHAIVAWLTRDAYKDGRGHYRLRSSQNRIAPWNHTIRALYPHQADFHRAAVRWLHFWDAVPLARLSRSIRP